MALGEALAQKRTDGALLHVGLLRRAPFVRPERVGKSLQKQRRAAKAAHLGLCGSEEDDRRRAGLRFISASRSSASSSLAAAACSVAFLAETQGIRQDEPMGTGDAIDLCHTLQSDASALDPWRSW